jgi:hypothetical protein
MHPAELSDDATFLRRIHLDIAGTLPTPDEIRQFLADADPSKRAKKIDALLSQPGYAALWATKFCDLLKASGFNNNFALSEAAEGRRFHQWLKARLAENVPYDVLVERILTASSREGRSQEEWLEEVLALSEENAKLETDLAVYGNRKTLDLYWQREGATGMKGTLQVAHAFLGLRMECAQCHRHPHDVWKQDDLLSFANFFMRIKGSAYPDSKTLPAKYAEMMKKSPEEAKKIGEEAKKITDKLKDAKLPSDELAKLKTQAVQLQMKAKAMTEGPKRFGTEVVHQGERSAFASVTSPLGTQKSETLRLLGDKEPIKVAKENDPRVLVMAWLRRPDNRFFARAIVNRIWAHYLGSGIVDPPDHLSPLNPPSHPELLDALANGLVENRYDLKWVHRSILNSRTYQQSCRPHATGRGDRRNYSAFQIRRPAAEILLDGINHATRGKEVYPARLYLPADARVMDVAGITKVETDIASVAYPFQIFGRPSRNAMVQCDCERDSNTTIVQTLYLANHPRVREKIAAPDGRLVDILKAQSNDAKRIEEVYLWTVSRLPSSEEVQKCVQYVKESPTPEKGYEDVMWSLLNTREFLLVH